MNITEKLRKLSRNMNRSAVARDAGMPVQSLINLLNRGSIPSAPTALKLAKVLGVDPAWLIDDAQSWPPVRVEQPADAHEEVAA